MGVVKQNGQMWSHVSGCLIHHFDFRHPHESASHVWGVNLILVGSHLLDPELKCHISEIPLCTCLAVAGFDQNLYMKMSSLQSMSLTITVHREQP